MRWRRAVSSINCGEIRNESGTNLHHEGTKYTKIFVGCAPRTGQFLARIQLNGNPGSCYLQRLGEALSLLSPATGEMSEGDLSTLFIWLRRSRARFCLVK